MQRSFPTSQGHPLRSNLLCFGVLFTGFLAYTGAPLLAGERELPRGDPAQDATSIDLANGDFSQGIAGWTLDPSVVGFGGGNGQAGVDVIDLAPFSAASDAACLGIFAGASWDPERASGSARQAQSILRREAVAAARYLEFTSVGQFEIQAFHEATFRYDAHLTVTNHLGASAVQPLVGDRFANDLDCESGVAGFGLVPLQVRSLDLVANGIQVGDPITIEITWSATVGSLDPCDAGLVDGILCVDDFRFHDAGEASSVGTSIPRYQKRANPTRADFERRLAGEAVMGSVVAAQRTLDR